MKQVLTPLGRGIVLATLLLARSVAAQEVKFTFVAPDNVIVSEFGAATAFAGYASGYRGVLITPDREATFKATAPPNLVRTFDALAPGATLRRRVDRVLQITEGKVDMEVLLVDDRTGVEDTTQALASVPHGDKRIVWPSASVTPRCATNDYCGLVRLGEEASVKIQHERGGWPGWEGTVVHESFHTQFVGPKSKWGPIRFSYGGDERHWRSELLGDQALPFEEGFGTFFGVTENPHGFALLAGFFTRTDERYALESRSVLSGTAEMWNAPHSEESRPIPEKARQSGSYSIRKYKWLDVPAYFLLFNENTATMFYGMFWKYANDDRDVALEMAFESAASIMWHTRAKRSLMFAVNRLSQQLEVHAGTIEGRQARAEGTLTSGMFPFAVLDILTHFGMTEERFREVYQRSTSERQPRSYEDYWRYRETVRELVAPELTPDADGFDIDEAVRKANDFFQHDETIRLSPLVYPD